MSSDSSLDAIKVVTLNDLSSKSYDDVGSNVRQIEVVSAAGSYARNPPFFLDLTHLEHQYQELTKTYFAKLQQHHSAVIHSVVTDGRVIGQGSVVTRDGSLVRESAVEFLAHQLTPDGFAKHADGSFTRKDLPEVQVNRPTLLLKRPWYGNFGHWLVDSATLASLASKMSLPIDWQVAIARQPNAAMAGLVRETLAEVLPGVDVVEHPDDEIWHVSELHYVSPLHVPPLFKLQEGISCLRSLMLRGCLRRTERRRPIFVSRPPTASRRLINEADIIEVCSSLGVSVVCPERMSLKDQAALFRNADIVIGVKGAALTNAIFCSPRTHLVVLSPGDFPDPFFWDLVSPSGINYSEIFGFRTSSERPQGSNQFVVEPSTLRVALTKCLDEG